MKKTRSHSIERLYLLKKDKVSENLNKFNNMDQNTSDRDISDTCIPISRVDRSELNIEQAKAEIDKMINEKLDKISTLEFIEPEIDAMERERRKVSAEKRIVDRRNKKKERKAVNTSLDSSIDKLFVLYGINKTGLVKICHKIQQITGDFMINKTILLFNKGAYWFNQRLAPLFQRIKSKLGLKKKEESASAQMYLFIESIDKMNESADIKKNILIRNVYRHIIRIRKLCRGNKKKVLVGFGAGVAVYAAITIMIGGMTAYEYIYNGKVLGIAKNQEDVNKIVDIIGDKLSYQYNAEITIDKEKDIRFKKILGFNQDIDSKEDILNRLTYMRDMKANGHGIYVDGKLVTILESKESAKNVLNEIKNTYIKEDSGIEYKRTGFAESVEIIDIETKLGNIQKKNNALDYLMTGAIEEKIHVVQSGETFSEIAKMYGLKQSELQYSNPSVVPEKLQIGQEICLNQIVPLVTVQTIEIAQYKEAIPYEIAYENTGSLYKNEQTVKSRGTNGEKDVVAEIVRNNGIEVSRKEISTTILFQPVSQVVLVGTKEPPPLIGTGSFVYPVRGTLTSRYGSRWGRLHSGIDLAAPTGTKIKAADGGKVTYAGYRGALGYMVAIDHGGGRESWYGHCSKLHVKKGERVYQGQHIANVGSTGRSTGPHLHFEVHINGKSKNPLNYL
ncbi:MAG: peptidoglycan DD-metalloendopeptidase family protein [Eubacteriales bacterium]|nr:peptidoglycan DD-metalloendopeptidase family protein [Eubacteriales bacterium]MDD4629683.1 peptidoglycan DD-metalloendopeptidase family protein [Eubacteriales bacterium]